MPNPRDRNELLRLCLGTMSLYVVATPIGNDQDLSTRAADVLKTCTLVIGEEDKQTRRLLKRLQLELKPTESLNEHSTPEDVERLAILCEEQDVALVSDCGTPGFNDPGADLVAACRQRRIPVRSVPGPSSLTAFLSVCGLRLDEFWFRGFLPANTEERRKALHKVREARIPVILMDTPYRLAKLLSEIAAFAPRGRLVLGMDLSTEQEQVFDGEAEQLAQKVTGKKAEFLLIYLPSSSDGSASVSCRRKMSK